MSDTYIGWDGKRYPWPPPEGWYHASDGRWWAPETGPNPPPSSVPSPVATPPPGVDLGAQTARVQDHQAPLSTGTQPLPGTDATSAISHTNVMRQAATPPRQDPDLLQSPYINQGGTDGPSGNDVQQAAFRQPPPNQGSGLGGALLIISGMVAAVLVGGLAYFYVTADGSDVAAGETTDTTADEPADSSNPSINSETTTDESQTTPATDESGADTDEDDPTTTESDTDDPDASTTTASIDQEVTDFRDILLDNDLTSESLTDDDILSFADNFCGLAETAQDENEFEDIRAGAIQSISSALSDEELRLIIDAAVITFCPDEAERLSVDL